VITDLTEEGSGDDTTYRPTVEYEVDGETYNVKLDNSVKADSVGNTITVLYDPSNPELAYGKNGMGIYLLIVCPLILAFVLISIFKGRGERQENKERQESSGYTGYAPHVAGGERELISLPILAPPRRVTELKMKTEECFSGRPWRKCVPGTAPSGLLRGAAQKPAGS
jgi:hypothetical protein